MDVLYKIFGPPHELLHVLALLLIGRRPKTIGYRHVDIPDDLGKWAYIFVAGLPAVVFWGTAIFAGIRLATSTTLADGVIAFVIFSIAVMAGLGTVGDIQLIMKRLESN